jgi:DNA-binding MarR family transcriptional regulator
MRGPMKEITKLYDAIMENYLLLVESDRQFFARFQLSQVRYFTLFHIWQNPGISLTELSKKLLCTKGNATRIVQGMASEELLSIFKDREDQRALNIFLSEKGKEKYSQVKNEFETFNQQRFSSVNVENEKLIELMTALKTGLENSLNTIDR